MDLSWNEIVAFVVSNLLKLIVALVLPAIVKWVIAKIKNDKLAKYVRIAADVVSKCVSYVDQTYVDALKEDGMFDKEKQKRAFEMCKQRIVLMLNEEAKSAVIEAYGDFEDWLTNAIEAEVWNNKFSYISDPVEIAEIEAE